MPPIVIDLHNAEDTRDVVHRAVQTLAEGQLVVFPTETVYGVGASARSAKGIEKLFEAKGRSAQSPLALAIKSAEDALDYVPNLGSMGERLARRCWPGPITLVVDYTPGTGLVSHLPPSVQQAILPNRLKRANEPQGLSAERQQTLGLRVPAHQIVLDVLQMLTGPIALTSANQSGEPDAITAQSALESLGEHVALILDDGRCHYGQPSTVVRVIDNQCECLREGVVGRSALDRLSSMIVLLVCTGNTCRSPMAEVMMRRQIAERLGCTEDELDGRGLIVTSAGIAAMAGSAPSGEAMEVMQKKGLDLRKHESQPLTDKLVRHADFIYTMTASHRQAILRRWPNAALRTFPLRTDQGDIADPIGGTTEVYRQCADQIQQALQQRVAELDIS